MLDPVNNDKHLAIVLIAIVALVLITIFLFTGSFVVFFFGLSFMALTIIFLWILPPDITCSSYVLLLLLGPEGISAALSALINALIYLCLYEWFGL